MVGGAWREAGDVTAAAEFHVYCDPTAARQVMRCGAPLTLLPLDVTRQAVFSPTELLHLPNPESSASRFLGQIAPSAIAASAGLYGVEGCYLQDVFGLVALVQPQAFKTRSVAVDVETTGELTRGATICDVRWGTTAKANVELAVDVDVSAVRHFIRRTLTRECRLAGTPAFIHGNFIGEALACDGARHYSYSHVTARLKATPGKVRRCATQVKVHLPHQRL